MRQRKKRNDRPDELTLAIGLVWGHLNVQQYEEAYHLAKGCLRIWPEDSYLLVMAAYAAAELLEPLDERMLAALKNTECKEWANLVFLRAGLQSGGQAASGRHIQ
ncbi:hypothetical protein EGT07_13300 [Herbaspirillum sp. HC18]|nr:hypothetical protein EGT07_13300 [Herbaspirillum sp. HC18]